MDYKNNQIEVSVRLVRDGSGWMERPRPHVCCHCLSSPSAGASPDSKSFRLCLSLSVWEIIHNLGNPSSMRRAATAPSSRGEKNPRTLSPIRGAGKGGALEKVQKTAEEVKKELEKKDELATVQPKPREVVVQGEQSSTFWPLPIDIAPVFERWRAAGSRLYWSYLCLCSAKTCATASSA